MTLDEIPDKEFKRMIINMVKQLKEDSHIYQENIESWMK